MSMTLFQNGYNDWLNKRPPAITQFMNQNSLEYMRGYAKAITDERIKQLAEKNNVKEKRIVIN